MDALQSTNLEFEGTHLSLEFNQDGEDLAKKHEQDLDMTKLLVEKVQKRYEKQVNARRSKVENEVVQKVLLNVNNLTLPEGLTPKFTPKNWALFSIVEWMFKDMHKLELLPEIKMHSTFYVSLLKPFKEKTLCPDRKQVIRPAPDLVGGPLEHEVRGHPQV